MAVVYNYNAGPTYTKIANITLSSDQNDITFSNIPQNYTDLVFVVQAQSNATGSSTNGMRCRINSDSGTNYSYTTIQGNGTSASSYRETSVDYFIPGEIPQTSATSRSLCTFSVMNYANTTTFKTIISRGDSHTVASAAVGLWRSTAAVTSVSISRNFFVDSTSKVKSGSSVTLYGITAALKPKATGGNTVTTDGTYWYHTFTSSGVFTPSQNITADYLVVAGGGGSDIGGGGAGGLRSTVTATGGGGSLESALSLTTQAYTVTVGAGGGVGSNGNNSVFSTITSTGGGAGRGNNTNGNSGGSGGGGGYGTSSGGTASPSGQGYAGGGGAATSGGGGGGAGAVGANSAASNIGGAGGNGVAVSISGSSVTYGGGGGGAGSSSGGAAGSGGGGAGSSTSGGNGTANRGGGGGGGWSVAAASGGSGIVIVRYSA